MKLSQLIILTFVIVAVVGSVGGSYYSYTQNLKIVDGIIINQLESTAQARANHVETVLIGYEQRARLLTSKTWMKKHLKSYFETGEEEYRTNVEVILAEVQEANPKFLHISIINSEGKIIISTNKKLEDKDVSDKYFFIGGKDDYALDLAPHDHEDGSRIHMSGPLIQDGEFLGVVAVASDGESLYSVVRDYTGLGETGEVLIAMQGDNERIYLAERRFESEALFQEIESEETAEPMKQALLGNEETFKHTLDYRDELVTAVSQYIEIGKVGLVAKMDHDEVVGSVREEMIKVALIVIIFISIMVSILGFFIARYISKPIIKLSSEVDAVSKGQLDVQLEGSNFFEIQSLINSLNRVLASLKLAILRTGASKSALGLGDVKKQFDDKHKIFFEDANDLIQRIDVNGKVIEVNKKWKRVLGYSDEDIEKGVNLKNVVDASQFKHCMNLFGKVIAGNNVSNIKTIFVSKQGKKINVEVNASPVFDDKGKVVSTLGIVRAVSDKSMMSNVAPKKSVVAKVKAVVKKVLPEKKVPVQKVEEKKEEPEFQEANELDSLERKPVVKKVIDKTKKFIYKPRTDDAVKRQETLRQLKEAHEKSPKVVVKPKVPEKTEVEKKKERLKKKSLDNVVKRTAGNAKVAITKPKVEKVVEKKELKKKETKEDEEVYYLK
jgi:PAS domain S-box-containing protein